MENYKQQGYIMNEFMKRFQKAMRDEISASIVYIKMAQSLSGFQGSKVADELLEHSKEEFEHYNELIDFATKHGFVDQLDYTIIDMDVIKNAPMKDINAIMLYTQELEQTAISDYNELGKMAEEAESEEARKLFFEIMGDEQEHFDDLAVWLDQTRPCMLATQDNKED